ncbi:DNA-directed RNA polymerase II subunit [Friedmanniomyces endolithicus]|nr:DNA-directed RNA polymerase II subunit [Friedmanniomyces endolithicus]
MFCVKLLQDTLPLHPSYFGAASQQYITDLLYTRNEGKNTGTMMIIAIIDIDDISEAKIMPGTGMAMYDISYRAIIWRPFRGEVVDGLGLAPRLQSGLCRVLGEGGCAHASADESLGEYMIPAELKYTVEGSTPSFTDNDDQTIERSSQVRLRIKGIRGEMGQMYAIGSIREDYLGYASL